MSRSAMMAQYSNRMCSATCASAVPHLPALLRVVTLWAKAHAVNDVSCATLSSYSRAWKVRTTTHERPFLLFLVVIESIPKTLHMF